MNEQQRLNKFLSGLQELSNTYGIGVGWEDSPTPLYVFTYGECARSRNLYGIMPELGTEYSPSESAGAGPTGMYDNETEKYLQQPEADKGLWFVEPGSHTLYIVTLEDHEQGCWCTENLGPDDEIMDRINELCREGYGKTESTRGELAKILDTEFGLKTVPYLLHRFAPDCGYYVA